MKTFITGLLVCLLLAACHSEQIGPSELLYKTWVRQSGTYLGAVSPYKNLIIEFRPDGQLLYGEPKHPGGCCLPAGFHYADSTLLFGKLLACPTVRCAPTELTLGITWQIETLTNTELIISTDKQRIVFKAQ